MTEHRQQNRDSLFLLAVMRLADQRRAVGIRVRNLSSSGMMGECATPTQAGARLSVDLGNCGWVSGSIAWAVENRFGVVFDSEIDASAVRRPVSPATALPENCVRRPLVKPIEPAPCDPAKLRMIPRL